MREQEEASSESDEDFAYEEALSSPADDRMLQACDFYEHEGTGCVHLALSSEMTFLCGRQSTWRYKVASVEADGVSNLCAKCEAAFAKRFSVSA
eukprot:2504194-Amphidinium_carterae.1